MDKEKQILGMARVIYENTAISCVDTADEIAVELYDKGYCKSSDVAREIFEEIDRLFDKYPTLRNIGGMALAELKKKYTEEGK